MTTTRPTSSQRRRKVSALLIAGLVAGVGATSTLAVWNDSEWIAGGIDTDGDGIADTPGIGTSAFEVQQNTSSPFDPAAWADRETNPGGALVFTPGALSLSPGTATYAPVSLRTTADSIAAGAITLAPSEPAAGIVVDDLDGLLYAALDVRVVVNANAAGGTPAACDAASFDADAIYVIGSETAAASLFDGGTAATTLAAASGDQQDYCFEISLPGDASSTLQGRTVAPAWQFLAESV